MQDSAILWALTDWADSIEESVDRNEDVEFSFEDADYYNRVWAPYGVGWLVGAK
jgi:hypothetical protein